MGLLWVECPVCGEGHLWHTSTHDQRCILCRPRTDGNAPPVDDDDDFCCGRGCGDCEEDE